MFSLNRRITISRMFRSGLGDGAKLNNPETNCRNENQTHLVGLGLGLHFAFHVWSWPCMVGLGSDFGFWSEILFIRGGWESAVQGNSMT